MTKIPDEKKCPICKETKPAESYFRDKSRSDGLKYCCKTCVKQEKEQPRKGKRAYQKRDLDNYKKLCGVCGRTLAAKCFVYSHREPDGLELRCRTCRSWRSRTVSPTPEQVEAYEDHIDNIIQSATMQLLRTYDEGSLDVTIAEHRSEFEQLCVIGFQQTNLGGDWKMPIWIHSSSIP